MKWKEARKERKEEIKFRFKGLFGIVKERKKYKSLNSAFSNLFSVIALFAGIWIATLNLVAGILIVIFAMVSAVFFASLISFRDALRVEKKAREIIIQYLDKRVEEYKDRKKEYKLIDRKIQVGYPLSLFRKKEWQFQEQPALDWLTSGIKNKKAHIFIKGQMGIGKSMLSLALTHKLAKEAKEKLSRKEYAKICIPLLIPLGKSEYFADKYVLEASKILRGKLREWIKDTLLMDMDFEKEEETHLENYLKNMYKDLSIFSLIYDGFDEFRYKEYSGKLAPLSLFKHKDKKKIWKGAVILTSRPFVLEDSIEKDLLQDSVNHKSKYDLALPDYDTLFGFIEVPLFSDEDSWKFIKK
ncbi:MAG: hypothetical protein ACXABJ_01030, partial [Candidatus Heimdallarchaeaceae archaeon]